MSYVIPSVLVYQQLENAGGVLNTSPDLEACIIGPLFNVLKYVAGSTSALIATAAQAATTAKGSTTVGSKVVTFDQQTPFSIGDTLHIPGAGMAGSTLSGRVDEVSGMTATLDTAAIVAVTDAVVTKTGVITNSAQDNAFSISGQKPGQLVEQTSVQVYLNNASIETLVSKFSGFSGESTVFVVPYAGTGDITTSSSIVTNVSDIDDLAEGDTLLINGIESKVLTIAGTDLTVDVEFQTTAVGTTITKPDIQNVNVVTSTLVAEPGDDIVVSYKTVSNQDKQFSSKVVEVVNTIGDLTNISFADMIPADFSLTSTAATVTSGADTLTVADGTGFLAGDVIRVSNAGAGGADLITTVGTATGNILSGLNPTITTSTTDATVTRKSKATVSVRKLYNNQLLAPLKANASKNYTADNVSDTGIITIHPNPEVVYGRVVSGNVHFAYKALRLDLSGAIQTIANPADIVGTLGEPTSENPLALGVQIAMANTTTQVKCIAIQSDDLQGYMEALELAEGERVYALAPLTQQIEILSTFQAHVEQMSTPEEAHWRMALVNTKIPTADNIGPYSKDFVNANGGNNTITVINGKYVLTASNATFVSDGMVPGDIINITAGNGTPSPIGTAQVQTVLNNQQVVIAVQGTATAVSYYASRNLSKTQKAAAIAAASKTFGSNRIVHIQPDTVGITEDGVTKYLPGYYLCCAVAGMIAGFPVQQGFTNVGVAGIADIKYSNFYFTRAQLGVMAENGTFLFVQEAQGTIPYCRHELTTDVSTLYYREVMLVKDWDFLSYSYYDVLKSFIGKYNITPATLNIIRQTITAKSELIRGQTLPKLGPPLLNYNIRRLEQDKNNLDQVICEMEIEMPICLNYLNLYLIV